MSKSKKSAGQKNSTQRQATPPQPPAAPSRAVKPATPHPRVAFHAVVGRTRLQDGAVAMVPVHGSCTFAAAPIVPMGDASFVVCHQVGNEFRIRTYGSALDERRYSGGRRKVDIATRSNRQAFSMSGDRLPDEKNLDIWRAMNQSLQAMMRPGEKSEVKLPEIWIQVESATPSQVWTPAAEPVASPALDQAIALMRAGKIVPTAFVMPFHGEIVEAVTSQDGRFVHVHLRETQNGNPSAIDPSRELRTAVHTIPDRLLPDDAPEVMDEGYRFVKFETTADQKCYCTTNEGRIELTDADLAMVAWPELKVSLPGYVGRFMRLKYLAPVLAEGHKPPVVLEDFRELLGITLAPDENRVAAIMRSGEIPEGASLSTKVASIRKELGTLSKYMTQDDIVAAMQTGASMRISGLAAPQAWLEKNLESLRFRGPGRYVDFSVINKLWANSHGPVDRALLRDPDLALDDSIRIAKATVLEMGYAPPEELEVQPAGVEAEARSPHRKPIPWDGNAHDTGV